MDPQMGIDYAAAGEMTVLIHDYDESETWLKLNSLGRINTALRIRADFWRNSKRQIVRRERRCSCRHDKAALPNTMQESRVRCQTGV